MYKTKRLLSAVLCVVMVLSVLSCISFQAFAATTGGSKAATITVTTKANYWYPGASSITLKQEKQTLSYKALLSNKTKTKTGYYGNYNISVYNVTKKKRSTINWNGGQTKKITFDPDCTYQVTVSYDSFFTGLNVSAPLGYFLKSTSNPSWRVNSSWKVSSYK